MRTFHLESLGCNKNLIDSEMMLYLMKKEYEYMEDPREAEIIIVNTCAFIDDAKEEAIDTILTCAEYKTVGKCKKLVVAGCLSQRYGSKLKKEIPEIDILLGTGDFTEILERLKNKHNNKFQLFGKPDYNYPSPGKRSLLTPSYSAYLKVAEGCNNHCSYCVIPQLRGAFRSRPPETILEEAEILTGQGVKEIILTAQDTSLYGNDLSDSLDLSRLLTMLAETVNVDWLRFLYFYPTRINDSLLETMSKYSNICKYLDIPIQHVNKDILESMGRQGDYETFYRTIEKIRDIIPQITLRTTLIVGYPGETEKEFNELMEFLKSTEFDWVGVFPYSPQENTLAYKLDSRPDDRVVNNRFKKILQVQSKITQKNYLRWLNKTIRVLVEGRSELNPEFYNCRAENQAPETDGIVYIKDNGAVQTGNFVNAKIYHVDGHDLMGEVSR
mgnify:CR=1 FL=1